MGKTLFAWRGGGEVSIRRKHQGLPDVDADNDDYSGDSVVYIKGEGPVYQYSAVIASGCSSSGHWALSMLTAKTVLCTVPVTLMPCHSEELLSSRGTSLLCEVECWLLTWHMTNLYCVCLPQPI
jgi:hypothetical protein